MAQELDAAQTVAATAQGADKSALESGEEALASELRSLRHLDSVAAQVAAQLSTLSAQLEGLVAAAGELVVSAGVPGADLSVVSSELTSLTRALDEARRIMPAPGPGEAPGSDAPAPPPPPGAGGGPGKRPGRTGVASRLAWS